VDRVEWSGVEQATVKEEPSVHEKDSLVMKRIARLEQKIAEGSPALAPSVY